MKVKELLDKIGHDVYSVSPDTTVFEALKLMAEKEIGAVLVLEGKKIVGIMSERDYARKVILLGKASKQTSVKEIMSSGVVHTNPDVNVEKCLSLMTKHKFRYLPVMEQDRLVGIISIDDVRGVT
ncbi:MAG: CBS domain-containing protein [Desulfobacterales bacterium]|nr:CBS domain-containing protein [Deltaproteobacteria bacterium]MBT8361811.1 CBS domain-containing protein [Deltaproteobacteria bacterium]NNK95524.1 CBS domain-containing protein [Desulfobacterales bacterium]